MKKKYIIEIVIAAILVIANIIAAICYVCGDNVTNIDTEMTALMTLFIAIYAVFIIVLLIINGNWRKDNNNSDKKE